MSPGAGRFVLTRTMPRTLLQARPPGNSFPGRLHALEVAEHAGLVPALDDRRLRDRRERADLPAEVDVEDARGEHGTRAGVVRRLMLGIAVLAPRQGARDGREEQDGGERDERDGAPSRERRGLAPDRVVVLTAPAFQEAHGAHARRRR